MQNPTRLYTAFAGIFLLLQGTSTLAFRLIPALDQAFPALLAITQMVPIHSLLHILTGLLALAALYLKDNRGTVWFATGFGVFYIGLALVGIITQQATLFQLQSFDHPIHLLLGGLGVLAAGVYIYSSRKRKEVL